MVAFSHALPFLVLQHASTILEAVENQIFLDHS